MNTNQCSTYVMVFAVLASGVLMANTVSLLPGTLSAELDEEFLHVHVLDKTGAFESELAVIEVRVARMFGLNLAADEREE